MSTLPWSFGSGECQSTSKYLAYLLRRPRRSRSHHQRLFSGLAIDMWLGTMSRTWPSPFSRRPRLNRAWASEPPSSELTRAWSTTS